MMAEDPRGAPKVLPYEPFPAFPAWAAIEFDAQLFARYEDQLRDAKASADPDAVARALETALKWAAVDTGAIEGLYEVDRGFTYTVAAEAAAWDSIHLAKGVEVARAIGDAMNAYEGVLDVATNARPVTEAWIRGLHATICASQDTYTVYTSLGVQARVLPKGEYKTDPNNPLNLSSGTVHGYASPIDTPSEMARLVEQLRSDEFSEAHPVLQASYAHYAFVSVHPFADGNGRVARALASVYLYRRPGLPLVVFADQKATYFDALEVADEGDPSRFVGFTADRVIDAIAMVRDEFSAGSLPVVADRVESIRRTLTGRGGIEHAELDLIAQRLLSEFFTELQTRLSDLDPEQVHSFAQTLGEHSAPKLTGGLPDGYRAVRSADVAMIQVQSQSPAIVTVSRSYRVVVARPETRGPDFMVLADDHEVTEAFLRDINPTVSQALTYRLSALARREVSELLGTLEELVAVELAKLGYR